jgi:N-acetylmuramoyl-L-alanine amidase
VRSTRRAFLVRSLRASAGGVLLATFGGPLTSLALQPRAPKIELEDFHDERPPAGSFTSAPQTLPSGTTHVGIHWRGEARKTASVHARTAGDGGRWSEWVELAIDDDPFGDEETFAALLDVRGATELQYRVTLPGGRRLDRVTVTTIDADAQSGSAVLDSAAHAASGTTAKGPSGSFTTLDGRQRGFHTREDWGCDESLGLKADGSRIWPAMFVRPLKVIVHHTATSNRYSDSAPEVRAIYAYHARTKGWGDIGYNALVDRFGNLYEGRRGRETSPREYLSSGGVAGHVYRHNYGTVGAAVLGDFTKRKISLSNTTDSNMAKALEDLVVYECGRGGMRADGSSDFLKSDDSWHDRMPTISGHKDSEASLCPGSSLYSHVNGPLKTNVTARLAPLATPNVTLSDLPGREAIAPASLSFTWSSAASVDHRLEGWRKINADDIEYWTSDGWTRTEPTGWTTGPGSGRATFASLANGHYTFHVRGYDASGKRSAVEANFTVLVK